MSRHPLRKEATWVIVVGALATILGQWGVDAEVVGRIVATAMQSLAILVALGVMVARGEDRVTPMSDPRADDGTALVRADDGAPPVPEH